MATCILCPATVGRKNKSGYCAKCWPKVAWRVIREQNPEIERKRKDGIRLRYAADPEARERLKAHCRRISALPQSMEARRKFFVENRLWEKGAACIQAGSPARRLAGKRQADTKLSWCPRELRDEYKRLVTSHRIPAAEAKEIILAQHEKDMREFRRSIGG